VRTVRPFHAMSLGSPTFTDNSRAMPLPALAGVPHNANNRLTAGFHADSISSVEWFILVLNQCKCIECSPGKHPDIRPMAIVSDDDSLCSVHDRCLCIAV
jgi:hypothetical protein